MTSCVKRQANRVAEEEKEMSRMIFVNLPVEDLERSKRFYEAIGARNEPKFTNDAAAMMVLSDTISVMLLTKPFYSTFTGKPIADAHTSSQVLLAISCDSPAEVDRLVEAAAANGGKADPGPEAGHGRNDVRPQLRGSRRPPLGTDVDGPCRWPNRGHILSNPPLPTADLG